MTDSMDSEPTNRNTIGESYTIQQSLPGTNNSTLNSKPSPNPPSQSLQEMFKIISTYSKPGYLSAGEASQVSLSIIELMSDEIDSDALKFSSRFITPSDYEDIIVERNILHKCGYPICNEDPKGIKKAHQINYRTPKMILPSTYLSKYCTKEHYQASTFFCSQLSEASLFTRKDVTYLPYGTSNEYELQIALMEEIQFMSETTNKSMEEIIQELKSLSIARSSQPQEIPQPQQQRRYSFANPADPYLVGLSNQIKSFKISERDSSIPRLDASNEPLEDLITNGVEGYRSQLGRSI